MSSKLLVCSLCTLAFSAIGLSLPDKRETVPTEGKKVTGQQRTAAKPAAPALPATRVRAATSIESAAPAPAAKPLASETTTPAAATGATLTGRVSLPAPASAPIKNQHYKVVSSGKVLAMDPPLAVVYLEGTFLTPAAPLRATMHQRNFMFQPALLPVQTGTVVEFPNEDDTYHNVFSYSKTKRFDLGRYLSTEKPVPFQVFDKAGLVQLHSDIHEHMRAVILVLDTPHFTLTDAAGDFRLTGLPAGNFKLKAWLNSAVTKELSVALSSGAAGKADFP